MRLRCSLIFCVAIWSGQHATDGASTAWSGLATSARLLYDPDTLQAIGKLGKVDGLAATNALLLEGLPELAEVIWKATQVLATAIAASGTELQAAEYARACVAVELCSVAPH